MSNSLGLSSIFVVGQVWRVNEVDAKGRIKNFDEKQVDELRS
jgi:hypothetical protein